jgi:hypothetical protein
VEIAAETPPPTPPEAPWPPEAVAPAPPRRRRRWIILTVAAIASICAAASLHLWANLVFDQADGALRAAVDRAAAVRQDLGADALVTSSTAVWAGQIVDVATDAVVAATAVDALASATAEAEATLGVADDLLDSPLPVIAEKPLWTWDLLGLASEFEHRTADADDARLAAEASAVDVGSAQEELDDAGVTLFASAAPAAAKLETANISARSSSVLDFRDSAETVAGLERVGSRAVAAVKRYTSLAAGLVRSNANELAEKAGPLAGIRLEIEAYARSISGGVVLDFDWAPVVNGYGGSWGMAGTATWTPDRGGYSTITLSDSVAEQWPSADARALVTHEVGHSITSKCWQKFDSSDSAANEEWATAWAISLGHTASGNGTQAYGYPSQGMIDLAATCR